MALAASWPRDSARTRAATPMPPLPSRPCVGRSHDFLGYHGFFLHLRGGGRVTEEVVASTGTGPVEGGSGSVEGGAGPVEGGAGSVEGGSGLVEDGAGSVEVTAGSITGRSRPDLASGEAMTSLVTTAFFLRLRGGGRVTEEVVASTGTGPIEGGSGSVEGGSGPVEGGAGSDEVTAGSIAGRSRPDLASGEAMTSLVTTDFFFTLGAAGE
jgi:hypothetical protein